MSIKHLLSKCVSELRETKGFSFGAGMPHTADQYGVGDVSAWIPSGLTLLDRSLGGGMPLGRISELFSEQESEGKTTLALQFAVQTQKAGGVYVHLEAENSLDRPRAARLGINLETAIIFGPPTAEDAFLFIDKIITTIDGDKELQGCPVFIVWDTIAATPTKAEKDGDPFGNGMAERSRIFSQALRRYCNDFFRYKVHLCLVNQSITNIGNKNPYGPQFTTPCGKAVKFYSTLRVKTKRAGYIGESRNLEAGDKRLGILSNVVAVKNKLALPFQYSDLHLYGETGYDDVMSMANYFLETKQTDMLGQSKGRYHLPNGKAPFWKDLRAEATADPKILSTWRAKIAEMIPIPPNREIDPKTGWVIRKEGCRVEEAPETEEKPDE
jgi:protein RecA